MKILFSLALLFFVFIQGVYTQDTPNFSILEIKKIESFPIVHLSKYADRKVTFKLLNTSQKDIMIFGRNIEEGFNPTRYLLRLNKGQNKWEYPTPSGEPVKWNKVSSESKKVKILKPGEFITFTSYYSSEADCGQFFKVSVQIKIGKSKKTLELLSEQFETEPCS